MTYNIIVIGCQMNIADAERISSYLEGLNYTKISDRFTADLVVLVTCGVRQGAEDRVYGLIKELKEKNKNAHLLLTGCLSLRDDVKKKIGKSVYQILPANQIQSFVPPTILPIRSSNKNSLIGPNEYLKISPKYSNTYSAFIPIGNGCNNFCSYCVVPYARGREVYRPSKEIISEVKKLISQGYHEIILIAQNVNSYRSGRVDFSDLLSRVDMLPGNFWIRFSTSHPKDLSKKLIETIKKSKKVCHHLHLAVQSGDDGILEKMNRKYSVEHYKNLISSIRKAIPDIIVGFPGETKKQFSNTARLMTELSYDMAYLAQYSPRPGTVAEKMPDNVSRMEKKRRENLLNDILKKTALQNNQKYIGKTVTVLVDSKKRTGEWVGKDEHFKTVIFNNKDSNLVGRFVKVKIHHVKDFGLYG